LTHPNIVIPSRGRIYSFNEGNSYNFYPRILSYLESVKYPQNGKPYSARYVGSMVADVHRTLLYGGIFGYPEDKQSPDGESFKHAVEPSLTFAAGKLRILYEAFPMAFLIEQVRYHLQPETIG
jgi:fructose-1,6-bisphosphatase I